MNKHEIQSYLENDYAFRDYRFVAAKRFGKLNVASSINIKNPSKRDLDDAVSKFSRDGFSQIIIYLSPNRLNAPKPKRVDRVLAPSRQL